MQNAYMWQSKCAQIKSISRQIDPKSTNVKEKIVSCASYSGSGFATAVNGQSIVASTIEMDIAKQHLIQEDNDTDSINIRGICSRKIVNTSSIVPDSKKAIMINTEAVRKATRIVNIGNEEVFDVSQIKQCKPLQTQSNLKLVEEKNKIKKKEAKK